MDFSPAFQLDIHLWEILPLRIQDWGFKSSKIEFTTYNIVSSWHLKTSLEDSLHLQYEKPHIWRAVVWDMSILLQARSNRSTSGPWPQICLEKNNRYMTWNTITMYSKSAFRLYTYAIFTLQGPPHRRKTIRVSKSKSVFQLPGFASTKSASSSWREACSNESVCCDPSTCLQIVRE